MLSIPYLGNGQPPYNHFSANRIQLTWMISFLFEVFLIILPTGAGNR
jgi:hypothetical protein